MKTVKFKRWIPVRFEKTERVQSRVKGTGCFEPEFNHEGLFHGWGVSYEELETGAGNYTVAIVELKDGTIEEVMPKNVKFKS